MSGHEAYEADCKICPKQMDGKARPKWDELNSLERWNWERSPFPRERVDKRPLAMASLSDVVDADPVVQTMARHGATSEQIAVALYNDKKDLQRRIIELESKAPRRFRLPSGKIVRWDCPDEFLKVEDLHVKEEG